MDSGPPPPEEPVAPHTDTPPMRPRADSESSTSVESTRSVRTLTSDDVEYIHENDRTYGNETFYLPCIDLQNNDFREQDRLSLQHQIFVQALQGRLTTRLLPSTKRILDLGTGPGHWAIAMARQHPQAEVVGIDMTEWDLSTTEATLGASRVTWELDDLDVWGRDLDLAALATRLAHTDFDTNTPFRAPPDARASPPSHSPASDPATLAPPPQPGWHFSAPFDLIHLRNMKGAFAHWEDVYAEIHRSLAPGGLVELADYDLATTALPPVAPGTPDPLSMLRTLYAAVMQASFKSGRPLGTFYMHPSYLEEAGFTDVQSTHVNVPIGQWADTEAQRSLGKMMLVVVMETLEPSTLRLLTKYGDRERVWSADEVRESVVQAQQELAEWCARAERGEVEGWCAGFKWITGRKSWHA